MFKWIDYPTIFQSSILKYLKKPFFTSSFGNPRVYSLYSLS